MYRDGARKSIWQSEVKKNGGRLIPGGFFDVAIIGGGITGISTAYRLQQSGMNCILMEANNIGFGTRGGTTAHFNDFFDTSYKEVIGKFGIENARLLADAGRQAKEILQTHVSQLGIDCDLEHKNAELFALDGDQEKQLVDIVEAARQIGYEMHWTDSISFPIPFKKAVRIPGQIQFHPIKYINALAQRFVENGGILLEDCPCTAFEENSHEVVLQTGLGELRTKHAVFATHTPPGISMLHFTTAPYRSYAIAFTLKGNSYPDALGYDLYDSYHYYRTHELEGRKLLIAGGEDHKTGHAEDTGACFSRLESYCRDHFKVDRVEFGWSSQYYEPADGLPSIGVLPSSEGRIFVATGFRGNGMTFGTLSSAIIADLIMVGSNKFEKLFNPRRFRPTAGFTSFISENTKVLKDMITDKVCMEHIRSLAEVQAGQAKVVRFKGSSYAIYAQENGELHILKSTCPHARCEVRWNGAELSWDCPCHGSRFNIHGRILSGPATSPLDRLE